MKKNIIASIVGVAAAGLLLTSCSGKPESVTAVVAGPDGQPAAVVVKYAKAVSAESVSADAFQIEGQEVEAVFVTDKDITVAPEKPECKGEKPECDTTKACPDAKAECDKAKAECDKAKPECDGQHKDCAKEAQCDSTKVQCDSSKVECEKAGKPECKEGKSEKCPEIAVPAVSVKQVKDIKAADGSALKAWSKAFPATKAVPCFKKGPKHHHHHGEACKGGE